jgi:ribose transport system substrate-binding protein
MRNMTKGLRVAVLLVVLALVGAACSSDDDGGTDTTAATTTVAAAETYTIGVSNTLVGNGWREQMICAVKAEALASGVVDKVIVANRNGGATEQIADIESMISQGVNAIVINPSDREQLNAAIEAATAAGIVVVSVDQSVTAASAYNATNNQVEYGRLGAEWLFEQLGGQGNVLEMRGIDGVPADTDRHNGFLQALENYPGITIVQETFTGWDPTQGAQQALEVLTSQDVDGIWTSGIDSTVVAQFQVAGKPYIPVVGADNNGFLKQMNDLFEEGFVGVAITNPPAIGGVGTSIAIDLLQGTSHPRDTVLTPAVFDMINTPETVQELYVEGLNDFYSSYVDIQPWTHYSTQQIVDCKGPGVLTRQADGWGASAPDPNAT